MVKKPLMRSNNRWCVHGPLVGGSTEAPTRRGRSTPPGAAARHCLLVSLRAVMAEVDETEIIMNYHEDFLKNDKQISRYPFCIVWTPIPILSWLLPFIGHMGICTSSGIIRDFAGSYFVSEDNMGFGRPTKYWKLDVDKVCGNGAATWDKAVHDASEEYKRRPHNLCLDNCHSHVAMALNLMHYDNSTSWNMVNLCALSLIRGKHVNWAAFLKTWLPFFMLCGVLGTFILTLNLQ